MNTIQRYILIWSSCCKYYSNRCDFFCNCRAFDTLGYETDDLKGQSLFDRIHPDDLAAVYTCHKTCKFETY